MSFQINKNWLIADSDYSHVWYNITRNEREREIYTWHHLILKLDCDGFTLKTVSKLLASWKLGGNNPWAIIPSLRTNIFQIFY